MSMEPSVTPATGPLTGALLTSFADVAEDATLCFSSDRVHRVCPVCGTIFRGSAWRAAVLGPENCPFCGRAGSRPLVHGALPGVPGQGRLA